MNSSLIGQAVSMMKYWHLIGKSGITCSKPLPNVSALGLTHYIPLFDLQVLE